MRLACLQFASQVGDTDNNLSRADAVIDKASPDELGRLDLLVLPELAFTGYNFRSLQHISPHLEDDESGISYLWARKTALSYGCTVVVGYPEKVDAECPAAPECYNSALIVDGEGDAVGNYRKSFLHCTDETWAHKSSEGFFRRELPGLGNVCLGISTDVNPGSLETGWDAFEFGIYIVEAQANVVILTMAWHRRDPILLERHPQEPDVDTLVYWVQRFEPIIRADREGEVIVVFCNKTGAEEEAIYTGTSAIIGIRQGEIFVYGVLGRGVTDLLIVDTDCPPRYKLTDMEGSEPSDGALERQNEACQSTPANGGFPMDSAATDADTTGLGCRPARPKLTIPWHSYASQPADLDRGAVMTPITPFEEDGWIPTPIGPKPKQRHWIWTHEATLFTLKEEDPSM